MTDIQKIDYAEYFDGFALKGFLSPQECEHYIALAENSGFDEAKVNMYGDQVMMKEVRNNDRVITFDEAIADALFKRAERYLPKLRVGWPTRCNECIRFYRYDPKQRFKWHYDGCYTTEDGKEESQLSFLVYLNDDYEGGATKFTNCNVIPEQGDALVFLHQQRHEGAVLTAGRKYVLRTDVMYPAF